MKKFFWADAIVKSGDELSYLAKLGYDFYLDYNNYQADAGKGDVRIAKFLYATIATAEKALLDYKYNLAVLETKKGSQNEIEKLKAEIEKLETKNKEIKEKIKIEEAKFDDSCSHN